MKKSSGSSRQGNSPRGKKNVWKNYDYDELPELNDEQLASFRKITPAEHEKLKQGVVLKVGRPKKTPEEKEDVPVSIRFSSALLEQLQKQAGKEGFAHWQTFAKKILSDYLKKTSSSR